MQAGADAAETRAARLLGRSLTACRRVARTGNKRELLAALTRSKLIILDEARRGAIVTGRITGRALR